MNPPKPLDGLRRIFCLYRRIWSQAPSLAWVVNDAYQDEVQTAYRVLEATSEEKIVEGAADVWDSGKVKSSDNTGVPYGGEALEGDKGQKLYHVPKDETVKPKGEAVFLRKEFTVTKPVKKAIVTILRSIPSSTPPSTPPVGRNLTRSAL